MTIVREALSRNISRKGPRHCRSLHGTPGQVGFPGFPVESCGFGRVRVVLFEENHIRVADESSAAGNPGTLGIQVACVRPAAV
jgi:hypothetical protein